MNNTWNKFIIGYCKVDLLCVNNDPNWLGWFILIVLGLFFSFCLIAVVGSAFESADTNRRLKEYRRDLENDGTIR